MLVPSLIVRLLMLLVMSVPPEFLMVNLQMANWLTSETLEGRVAFVPLTVIVPEPLA